jgi:hypothetical protein
VDDDNLKEHGRQAYHPFPAWFSGQMHSSRGSRGISGVVDDWGFKTFSIDDLYDISGTITVTTTKRTAICLATENGHNEVVQLLAKKGAERKLLPMTYSRKELKPISTIKLTDW